MLLSCEAGVQDTDRIDRIDEALSCPSITLVSGDQARGGYDFSAGTYTDLTPGDFYFSQGMFWANNLGQRGVVKVGACSSVDKVSPLPTTGYSRNGVKATVGYCYVSLTHNDERDQIVFRVTALTSTTVSLTWKMVKSGKWGATLIVGDELKSGYDFSARTYQSLTGGDFYVGPASFWANNLGQRGIATIGACSSVDSVSAVPMTGYWLANVTAIAGTCYVSRTHFEEHDFIVFRVDEMTSTTITLTWKLVDSCYGLSNPRKNVDCWLSKNSNVAQSLAWENRVAFGQSSVAAWPQWPNAQRDDLRSNFVNALSMLADARANDPDPLVDPPVNQETLQDNLFAVTVLSANDAWRLYIKTVAMSLAVELSQYVSWSIVTYDSTSLSSLFDSRHLLSYTWSGAPANLGVTVPQAEGYILISNSYDQATHSLFNPYVSYVTPAPPARALSFIRDQGLLGSTRLQTITNALAWARRLDHFTGGPTAAVTQRVWQYRGGAPVSRTIDTTVDPSSSPDPFHYTAGCHGTSGFLNSVLRVVNIPVDNNSNGHSLTRFMTEGLYLSHGDDPYFDNDIYGVPASAMLISEATFRSWFVTASPALSVENIGRGNTEAMIKYLSGRLQWMYCSDPVPNSDHAHSLIMSAQYFTLYPSTYTLSYLEHLPADPAQPGLPASLWDRLAQKVASNGGCTATKNALAAQEAAFAAVLPVSEQLNWRL